MYLRKNNLFTKIQLSGCHIAPSKIIGCPFGYVLRAQLCAHLVVFVSKKNKKSGGYSIVSLSRGKKWFKKKLQSSGHLIMSS
jgi:hypothetical protein